MLKEEGTSRTTMINIETRKWLKQKDKDIKTLRKKTYGMGKEHDRYILKAGNIKQGLWALFLFYLS